MVLKQGTAPLTVVISYASLHRYVHGSSVLDYRVRKADVLDTWYPDGSWRTSLRTERGYLGVDPGTFTILTMRTNGL